MTSQNARGLLGRVAALLVAVVMMGCSDSASTAPSSDSTPALASQQATLSSSDALAAVGASAVEATATTGCWAKQFAIESVFPNPARPGSLVTVAMNVLALGLNAQLRPATVVLTLTTLSGATVYREVRTVQSSPRYLFTWVVPKNLARGVYNLNVVAVAEGCGLLGLPQSKLLTIRN